MTLRKKAWKMLMMVKDRVIIREQDPCLQKEERRTIYNPYKKRYVLRKPTQRITKKEELQLLLRENEDERDVVWIGDEMPVEKEEGTIRIWMQNCNGIEKYGSDKMMYNLSTIIDNNVDYFAMIETRLNQFNKLACKKWDMAQQRIIPNGEIMITSTPGFPIENPTQPGGILSGYRGHFRTRYHTSKRDTLGRWHYHQFFGKERDLRIYSLYRVNNGYAESQGDTTAWTQQSIQLDLNNDRRNPRHAVIQDLLKELESAIADKLSIILLADANESLDGPEKTNEKLREMGMINLMEVYLGKDALPRTCNRGSNTIDHIWVTSNILSEVSSAGYAPFDFIDHSDHRGLYVDLKLKNILDENMFHLEPPRLKRLKSSIPMRVEKYLEIIEEQMKYHKIEKRYIDIYKDFHKNGKTVQNEEALNKLDSQITEIMKHAENKCSNLPTYGLLAWSTKLKDAIGNLIRTGTIRRKAQKLKIGMDVEQAKKDFEIADTNWKEAKESYQDVKSKTKELRKEHIEECAKMNVENDPNKTLKTEIKRLQTIEDQREQAARMKYVLKPFAKGGVTFIMIPAIVAYPKSEREKATFDHYNIDQMWNLILPHNGKDIKDWERITDKVLVQKLLLHWQRKHFTQAQETPLGNVHWTDKLRKKETQDKILDGTYQCDDVPEEIQEIFQQMKRPTIIDKELDMESTIDEFWAFINGASEKTSTSPSGRGYNHYKALMLGEYGKETVIATIHGILELARKYGIILDRWKKTVTTLMEKDAGRPRIHRMRALHIIEAEVQFIAKLNYCKKLMSNAEKYDLITSQQHGGRRNKQAQSAIINKLLYYNITHQRLMEAAFMDDDARNCYDRILTALSSVEMRSWGQSYEEAEFSVEFLHQQQYHIRTKLGITKDYYTYSREDPTFGSGQGIGWAGVKFTRTSDTICKVMQKTCKGMLFTDPEECIKVEKNANLFVDDTALGVTKNQCGDKNALQQLILDQQKHAFLLFASGHKLALDKCMYYWIDFIRDGDKYRHKFIEEMDGDMYLQEGYQYSRQKIKRLQPFASHRTLGSYISVNGNQEKQKKVLAEKIDNWCIKLHTRYLNGKDTLFAHSAYLEPALRYVLSTTNLSYDECNTMMKKIEGILLNAMHIQRNCSRAVLYAPFKFGGMNKRHLYHLQGLEKLRFLFMHYRNNDDTGKLIRICMKWTEAELGISKPFHSTDFESSKLYLTPTWFTHLWEYLDTCDVHLRLCDEVTREGNCKNDFYLMDKVRTYAITNRQKFIFNQVRLWLKVETASDIVVLGSSTTICPEIMNGDNYRTSCKHWPNIREIPQEWIKIWRKILKQYIRYELRQSPLGSKRKPSHQKWTNFVTLDKKFLQVHGKYYEYNRRSRIYQPSIREISPTVCFTRADIMEHERGYKLLGMGNFCHTIPKRLPQIPQWTLRNWGTAQIDESTLENIKNALDNDNLVAASDGSVLNGAGAHAFCLVEEDTHDVLIEGAAPVDGDPNYITSYRSEAFGALAAITLINYVSKKYTIQKKEIIIYIDNTETINTIKGKNNYNGTSMVLSDHIDITLQLRQAVRESPHLIIPMHVKSHDTGELSRSQELNEAVDHLVGEFIRSPPPRLQPQSDAIYLPAQTISIIHRNDCIEVDLENVLAQNLFNIKIMHHFEERHKIKTEYMPLIDFLTVEQVLKSNRNELPRRIKNINSEWNTMYVNKKWGKSTTSLCPVCHQKEEDWKHVFSCQERDMKRSRYENIQKIDAKLTKLKTLQELKNHFLHVFKHWNQSDIRVHEDDRSSPYYSLILEAHNEQKKIGYAAFMSGFISQKWAAVQNHYYTIQVRDVKLNITRWKQSLLRLIYDFGHTAWKERCTILKAEKDSTEDARYREYLIQYHEDLVLQKNEILHRFDHHLLKRKRNFFTQSDRSSLEMWQVRVQSAIEREEKAKKENIQTIEKYIQRKKRPPIHRRQTDENTTIKLYRQTTLWKNVTPHIQTIQPLEPRNDVPIEPSSASDIAAQHQKPKRKILEQLVKKRKRRRKQMQLHPFTSRRCKRATSTLTLPISKKQKRKQNNSTIRKRKGSEIEQDIESKCSLSTKRVRRKNQLNKTEDIRTYLRRSSSDPKNHR